MSLKQIELLWELMESEALFKYILTGAESPAIIICTDYLTAPDAKKSEHYTLYFGEGITHINFSNLNKAKIKAKEIIDSSKHKRTYRVLNKNNDIIEDYRTTEEKYN